MGRMRRLVLPLMVLALTACTGSEGPGTAGPTATAPVRWPPAADAPVPTSATAMAAALHRDATDLRSAIQAWRAGPDDAPAPGRVVLLGLYQQRLDGTLAAHPALFRQVVSMLPADVADATRANVAANRSLSSLSGPPPAHPPKLRTTEPLPAGVLLRYYRQAQARFGVPWQVLAAVNFIESKFGRVTSASSAGAQGPMQFIPSTWKAYGMGGDVHDPRDAIMGAANYLHASGSPSDDARALFAYNPSDAYVRAILIYAHRMERDPLAFYEYYTWQVFVATRSGDTRITGPGT
jgi:membrane-bound lytic murein transglycosylase B